MEKKSMKSVFRILIAFAAVLAAEGGVLADTVTMKDNVTYDGKVISNSNGLIRMQVGDREITLPAADAASVETNDKRGQTVDYAEVERLATEHDKELVEKTGLKVQERDAVDELLQFFFSQNEAAVERARHALLNMAKTNSPYRYLQMQRRDILPDKLAPLLEVMFEMNPEDMRETLKETASSFSETARAASLRCLAKLGDKSSLQLMKRGLADEFPEVRIAAAHGVQVFGAREATPALLKALKAGDPRVRNAACDALSALWTKPGQPPLAFPQDSGWQEFWKTKAASVPGAWDPEAIEPLVPPGTVCLQHGDGV